MSTPSPFRHICHDNPATSQKRAKSSLSAFSLVEVTISLGIVSFALVTLMALLPVGLKTFIMSRDLTLEAQINQRLITEARQTSFSQLSVVAAQESTNYFDAEGNQTVLPAKYVYQPTVTITYSTNVVVNSGPGAPTAAAPTNAACVTVILTKISNPGAPVTTSFSIANDGF